MTKRSIGWVALLLLALLAMAACQPVQPSASEAEPEAQEVTLYVGPEQVDCTGVGPQKCLLVSETPDGEQTYFYDSIDGFDYEPGYEYELRVLVEPVENPPADASSLKYTLVEEVSKTPVSSAESAPAPVGGEEPTLEGVTWQLESYVNADGETVDALPGSEATATFEDGMVNGTTGCNNYGASYQVDGSNITFGVGPMTLMACPDAQMAQEGAYLAALGNAASYQIVDGQLQILDADGNVLLTYVVQVPVSLTGVIWNAINYNNGKEAVVSVIIETEITAIFAKDGMLSGSAGCNTYNASYETNGDNIEIGPAASTRMFCGEPEGTMDQEAAYLAALETAATYSIQGDMLDLRTADGARVASYLAGDPVGEPAAEGAPDSDPLSPQSLANMTYNSTFTKSGEAPLENGLYSEEAAPGSATKTTVQLTDNVVYGELNGQQAAVVVLVTDPGGSGTFYDLAVVVDQDGMPVNVATTSLGDRVQINSLVIENNQIVVDMVQAGPNDPMCCPSQHVVNTYELQGDQLVEVSSEVIDSAEAPAQPDYAGVYTAEMPAASSPGRAITLVLNPDGSASMVNDYMNDEPPIVEVGAWQANEDGTATVTFTGRKGSAPYQVPNVLTFQLQGDQLVAVDYNESQYGSEGLTLQKEGSTASSEGDLTGVVWMWLTSAYSDDTATTPDDPSRYTIEFMADGNYSAKADCNQVNGAYATDGNSIEIGPGAMTLAACPPDSLADQFLKDLSAASTYLLEDGKLLFDLQKATGTMQFGP